jgi:hypothetical protein
MPVLVLMVPGIVEAVPVSDAKFAPAIFMPVIAVSVDEPFSCCIEVWRGGSVSPAVCLAWGYFFLHTLILSHCIYTMQGDQPMSDLRERIAALVEHHCWIEQMNSCFCGSTVRHPQHVADVLIRELGLSKESESYAVPDSTRIRYVTDWEAE